VTRAVPTFGACYFLLVSTCRDAHLHSKFEVSSFNHFGDRKGTQVLKEGHDLGHAHFGGILFFTG